MYTRDDIPRTSRLAVLREAVNAVSVSSEAVVALVLCSRPFTLTARI